MEDIIEDPTNGAPSILNSEMVERCARAMYEALWASPSSEAWVEEDPPMLDAVVVDGNIDLFALARAAIAAMREPDMDMVQAGAYVGPDTNHGVFCCDEAEEVYRAMIDAALNPPPA